MISLILIYKRDSLGLKIEIYYQTMGVMTKRIFKSLFLYIVVLLRTVLEKLVVKDVLIMYVDKSLQQCHSIITGMSVNYEE